MPTNPHIIPLAVRDPGSAQRMADLKRQANNSTKQPVVFGNGVQVTGGLVQTSPDHTVPRAFMVGDVWAGDPAVNGLPVGIYVTSGGTDDQRCVDIIAGEGILIWKPDGSDVAVSILPSVGIILQTGENEYNKISWHTPGFPGGSVGTYGLVIPGETEGDVPTSEYKIDLKSPNGHYNANLKMSIKDTGVGIFEVDGASLSVGAIAGVRLDVTGNVTGFDIFTSRGDSLRDIADRLAAHGI